MSNRKKIKKMTIEVFKSSKMNRSKNYHIYYYTLNYVLEIII